MKTTSLHELVGFIILALLLLAGLFVQVQDFYLENARHRSMAGDNSAMIEMGRKSQILASVCDIEQVLIANLHEADKALTD